MVHKFPVQLRLVTLFLIVYVVLSTFLLYKWQLGGGTDNKLSHTTKAVEQKTKLLGRNDISMRTQTIGTNGCDGTGDVDDDDDDTHTPPGALISRVVSSAMNATEKTIAIATLEKFADLCLRRNITYWIYSGTLLGSFRHHDVILWDDDIDVIIPLSERARAYREMRRLSPTYAVFSAGTRLKFWSTRGSSPVRGRPWRWPYVDISFYDSNVTHLWDASSELDLGERYYVYKVGMPANSSASDGKAIRSHGFLTRLGFKCESAHLNHSNANAPMHDCI